MIELFEQRVELAHECHAVETTTTAGSEMATTAGTLSSDSGTEVHYRYLPLVLFIYCLVSVSAVLSATLSPTSAKQAITPSRLQHLPSTAVHKWNPPTFCKHRQECRTFQRKGDAGSRELPSLEITTSTKLAEASRKRTATFTLDKISICGPFLSLSSQFVESSNYIH